MNPRILEINKNIQSYKEEIVNHPLYKKMNSVEDIAVLMEYHVYAVWDFMSLLKSLQSILTCTSAPWKPVGDTRIRRLINSIVLEEESDVDADGNPSSHYEMYLDAMNQSGANTGPIKSFVANVSENNIPSVNEGADSFLKFTFDVINSGEAHKIASAFTFGREDLIPDMFINIVKSLNEKPGSKTNDLLYYLERHIEMDGDEHGPMALKMISGLCGNDQEKWNDAIKYSNEALKQRIKLWDYISSQI